MIEKIKELLHINDVKPTPTYQFDIDKMTTEEKVEALSLLFMSKYSIFSVSEKFFKDYPQFEKYKNIR